MTAVATTEPMVSHVCHNPSTGMTFDASNAVRIAPNRAIHALALSNITGVLLLVRRPVFHGNGIGQ